MASEGTKRPVKTLDFRGAWIPSTDPLLVGEKNFSALANLVPAPNGLEGCLGYTRITTAAMSATYARARNGIQIRPRHAKLSYVLLQAINTAGTSSAILQQIASIASEDVPNTHDVEAAPLHVDASGAGLGRFHKWPGNHIAYCNGKETLVYAGDEMYPAAFMIADSPMTNALVNPIDYSEAITNDLQTSGNIASIGNAADTYTKLLCPMTGAPGDAIPDYSPAAHGNAAKEGTADISSAHPKFGPGSLSTPATGDGIYYADHADWDAPVSQKITYECQHYLPSITNALVDTEVEFYNNGSSADTIVVNGDQTVLAWLGVGRTIGTTSPTNPGPFTIGSTSYDSGTDKTTITLAAAEILTTKISQSRFWDSDAGWESDTDWYVSATVVVAEALSVMGRYQDTTNYWFVCFLSGVGYRLSCRILGVETSGYVNANYATGFNHVVVLCDGTDLFLSIDGNFEAASTGGAVFPALNAPYRIGRTQRAASSWTQSPGCFFAQGRISHINRWSTDFVPPDTPYRTVALVWVLFTRRPIQAVKYYLATINSVPGAVITGKEWDGAAWSPLTITDTTIGMTVSEGKTSFTSTINTAKPKLLEGSLFYVYQFELSEGSFDVYKVTVDSPIQPVRDLWDGVLRPVVDFRHYAGGTWINDTMNVIEETSEGVTGDAAYVASIGGLTATEYIDIAVTEQACAFKITMYERETGKVNTTAALLSLLYWNGAEYSPPDGLVDLTAASGKALAQTGYISWTPPDSGQEFQKTAFGNTFWRYRLTFSATLSATVWIDKVEAVPAPRTMNLAYAFPFMFQNRPMLCNLSSTGEGNRVDYPLTYAPEGWNGEESSAGDGKSPLYIGGDEDLTAACELYQRLGSSIYTFGLFLKAYETYILNGTDFDTYKDYQISNKIGCPAPLTLDTYQIFTSQEQQSSRCIAAWLSYLGPYQFDAGGLSPLPGIECYFDKNDPRCINFASIAESRGWFDPDLPQYNLQIPSGAGQITNNVWLVYDYRENRWYPKIPSATPNPYLGAIVRVADANDKQYVYGCRDNGHIMRLYHGTTYDGVDIEQYVETGEILPAGEIWDKCKMQLLKVLVKPLTEVRNLVVTIYRDGDTTGKVIATIPLLGTTRFLKLNFPVSQDAFWSCRIRFQASTSASLKGLQLLAWGFKYSIEQEDNK